MMYVSVGRWTLAMSCYAMLCFIISALNYFQWLCMEELTESTRLPIFPFLCQSKCKDVATWLEI